MIALQVASSLSGPLVSELIIVVLIASVLFVVMKVGKGLLKLVIGIIMNSVLGIIGIYLLNMFLGLSITLNLSILAPIVVFGLPAVGTIFLLKIFGLLAQSA